MPKGRQHVPSKDEVGVWFPHRGIGAVTWPPERNTCTSTGIMLKEPLNPKSAQYPPRPPQPYSAKDAVNFKSSNCFSAHDNRHSLQDHGVYFGDGKETRDLGKKLTAGEKRQHHTQNDYFKHRAREVVNYDYNTIYSSCYKGEDHKEPFEHRRRFPRLHQEGRPGTAVIDTKTTSWFKEPEVPYNTPLQVLANTQEPFLPHNTWKYSNRKLSKIYPPYDRAETRHPGAYPLWMTNNTKYVENQLA